MFDLLARLIAIGRTENTLYGSGQDQVRCLVMSLQLARECAPVGVRIVTVLATKGPSEDIVDGGTVGWRRGMLQLQRWRWLSCSRYFGVGVAV